jgi:hypothetical protein
MTMKQIEKKQIEANLPYELAKQIIQLLAAAKAEFKASAEEWDEVEREAIDLVCGE